MYILIRERPQRRTGFRGPPRQRGGNILWLPRGIKRPYKRLRRVRRTRRSKRRR